MIEDEVQPLGEFDKVKLILKEAGKNPEILLSGALKEFGFSPIKAAVMLPVSRLNHNNFHKDI